MALARWSPVNELTGLHNTMDRLFSDMFEGMEASGGEAPALRLPVDIQETKDGYQIRAPIAGFKPEEVDVTLNDGVLTIRATHQEEKNQQERGYIRRELIFGNMQRQILLPPDVKGENIKANVENGLLVVEVPRNAKAEAKRIEVQSQGNGNARETREGSRERKDTAKESRQGAKDNGKQQLVGSGSQSGHQKS